LDICNYRQLGADLAVLDHVAHVILADERVEPSADRMKHDVRNQRSRESRYTVWLIGTGPVGPQAMPVAAPNAAKRFDETFQFSTTGTAEGRLYTNYEITLHAVPYGTASTNTVPTAEFDSF
jgi:hypothetical protein